MNVRPTLLAALLLGSAYLPTSQPNGDLTDREYEVLSRLNCMPQVNQFDLACMMEDSTWAAPLDKSALAKIGRTSSLAQDYIRKNQQAAPLNAGRVAKAFHPKEG